VITGNPQSLARVSLLAAAIAHAEGFWVHDAEPRRHHNPGDMLDQAGVNKSFPSSLDGWEALAQQVARMLDSESHVYTPAMTWRRVAELWTGGDNAAAWCASVCADLDVAPDSMLGQFAGCSIEPAAGEQLALDA
jgi:hypothetical protein